ncbi:hypothetical protein CHUAL_000655 [Chamberlinius hualienensis]
MSTDESLEEAVINSSLAETVISKCFGCNISGVTATNTTNSSNVTITEDMKFNDSHVIAIATYSVLIVLSAVGNFTVLISLCQKQRQRKSRVNTLLIHLAVSDLMVTFFLMPLEVGWAYTVMWVADDITCRLTAVGRIIGLYMSSFILICISVDRWYAIILPLSVRDADRRTKIMLSTAWTAGFLCSLPQAFLFHVETHPQLSWYHQCVVFNSYPSPQYEIAYNLFVMMAMYGVPLVVIVVTYGSITFEINRKTKQCLDCDSKEINLRRSGPPTLNRARSKTLRMTIIMVAVFIMCWTPYYIICLWYWFHPETAKRLDQRIQKGLFIFACSNSCVNPLVYGLFMARCGCHNGRNKVKRTPL